MSRKQKRVFWPGLALIFLAIAALALVSVRANNSGIVSRPQVISATDISARAVSASLQGSSPSSRIEAELITATPHGFEPKQITRPPGRFLLMIDNRSGLALVSARLNLGAGIGLQEIALPREEPNWSDIINPQPGVYLLTEAS